MDMKTMWDNIYADGFNDQSKPDPRFVEQLTRLNLPAGRAVDVGAGEGADAIWLARQGWEVEALDYSQEAVRRLSERARRESVDLTVRQADATQFSVDAPVDLVYFGYLHLPADEMKQAFQRAWNALQPGGVLLYLGITKLEADQMPPGIDPDLFASAEALTELLPNWEIPQAFEAPCKVDAGFGPEERTGVVIVAIGGQSPGTA